MASACGRQLAGIAGSNPAGGMDVSYMSFVDVSDRATHSSREVLQSVVRPRVIEKPR